MQITSLNISRLPLLLNYTWLTELQPTITIVLLVLLAGFLLWIAIRLFRKSGMVSWRKTHQRFAASRRGTKAAQAGGLTGWTLIDVTGQAIPLRPLPFTIGRERGNTLVLEDPTVALRHARIYHDPIWGGLIIEDLDSPGGIQIDGQPTRQNLLQPDMQLRVGRYSFTIKQQQLRSGQ